MSSGSSSADSGVLSSLGQDANRERRKPKPSSLQDRFIPSRGVADARITCFEIAQAQALPPQHQDMNASPAKEEYKRKLASKLFQDVPLHDQRILAFSGRQPQQNTDPPLRLLYNANREAAMQPRKHTRHIPQSPERILDAPDLLDDYYLNLLDWNAQNILGAAPPLSPTAPFPPQPLRPACAPSSYAYRDLPTSGDRLTVASLTRRRGAERLGLPVERRQRRDHAAHADLGRGLARDVGRVEPEVKPDGHRHEQQRGPAVGHREVQDAAQHAGALRARGRACVEWPLAVEWQPRRHHHAPRPPRGAAACSK